MVAAPVEWEASKFSGASMAFTRGVGSLKEEFMLNLEAQHACEGARSSDSLDAHFGLLNRMQRSQTTEQIFGVEHVLGIRIDLFQGSWVGDGDVAIGLGEGQGRGRGRVGWERHFIHRRGSGRRKHKSAPFQIKSRATCAHSQLDVMVQEINRQLGLVGPLAQTSMQRAQVAVNAVRHRQSEGMLLAELLRRSVFDRHLG